MGISKIYLDTNIFKFSATKLRRYVPRTQTIDWGGVTQDIDVHDPVEINPNEGIKNSDLKAETVLLPKLSELGKNNKIKYYINNETRLEIWELPNMDSANGKFFGCPIETGQDPIRYSRALFNHNTSMREEQFNFLSQIKHKRFTELQKITGAYQGENNLNHNQLLDAFHIWCAEHNECDYFLTLDFKLIKVIDKSPNNVFTNVVSPSTLVTQLSKSSKHG